MTYTIIINGNGYELPKKTIKVVEELDAIIKIDQAKGLSIREKFKKLFNFIEKLVGKENAIEILGSDKLDDVDLSDVTLTVKKIIDAYDKPIQDYDTDKSLEKLNQLPLDKIVELSKVTQQ